eukprot:TRINITY_DN41214_c0_g1_i1.p1 TRINITY_DN41214_c0_g1~~TRINITY_DN41214_c0_g1_i1.p1  ORF type:complete len:379 (-),score=68.75 TRINITY_DN41214_c0_g1_i1:62-1198(-)
MIRAPARTAATTAFNNCKDPTLLDLAVNTKPDLKLLVEGRNPPYTRLLALSKLRIYLDPRLIELNVNWHEARPIFRQMNSIKDYQVAVDDIDLFWKTLDARTDEVGHRWDILKRKSRMEAKIADFGMKWEDIATVFLHLKRKDLDIAEENLEAWMQNMSKKLKNAAAMPLALARLRRGLEPLLPEGVYWSDAMPCLRDHADNVGELLKAVDTPDLVIWKLCNADQWPPFKHFAYARLRPIVEPLLPEGVRWQDFAPIIPALDKTGELQEAKRDWPKAFLNLNLNSHLWESTLWSIARLRKYFAEELEEQGNLWEEVLPMLEKKHNFKELQPSLKSSSMRKAFLEEMAKGPEELGYQLENSFYEPPKKKKAAAKSQQGE